MEFEDLVDDSTFLLGTRSGRSLGEERSEPMEPWLRQPEMGWDERPGVRVGNSWGAPLRPLDFSPFEVDSNRGIGESRCRLPCLLEQNSNPPGPYLKYNALWKPLDIPFHRRHCMAQVPLVSR